MAYCVIDLYELIFRPNTQFCDRCYRKDRIKHNYIPRFKLLDMTIRESDLPGVGKKFEVDLKDGEMIVVIHNTGKRELFWRPDADTDSEKVFEFSDDLARKIGSIIEGAYFQPVEAKTAETTLPGGILLEWYEVQPGSELIGETLASADIGNRSGFTIVAIQRNEETIDSPPAGTTLHEGDTVIGVGTRENCTEFEKLLAGN